MELHNEYKSEQLLIYSYRNRRIGGANFSTIIYLGKDKGFEMGLFKPKVKSRKLKSA
jgi:hypothetical protein